MVCGEVRITEQWNRKISPVLELGFKLPQTRRNYDRMAEVLDVEVGVPGEVVVRSGIGWCGGVRGGVGRVRRGRRVPI